jgi:two-component system, chemotaxis family, CheB/CheR fusion protein
VVVWNRGCEELWGMCADETGGQGLPNLDIGLPMDAIRPLIGHAFVEPDKPGESVVEAINRRGRATKIRVVCTGFQSPDGTVNGALLLMDPQS